ncbi:glycerol-3-phosphate dehydrogenase (NAD(+)) [Ranunculus cassubicifolius]
MGENTEEKHSNGSSIHNSNGTEEKLDELRRILGKPDGDLLKIVGVGASSWGCVFAALLQDSYGYYREKVQIRVWRRAGRAVDRATAEHLSDVINSREDVLRRLIRRCAYLKYVEARLGDRTLHADEILKDGFCLNMIDTPTGAEVRSSMTFTKTLVVHGDSRSILTLFSRSDLLVDLQGGVSRWSWCA